jgi:hypothetical protein
METFCKDMQMMPELEERFWSPRAGVVNVMVLGRKDGKQAGG